MGLTRQADQAARDARARYLEAIETLEEARAELVDNRSAAIWASLYPSATSNQTPGFVALAAGLRRPIEKAMQVPSRVVADGVFAALRADAEVLPAILRGHQAVELGATKALAATDARWTETPEGREGERRERQAALARFRSMWGHDP